MPGENNTFTTRVEPVSPPWTASAPASRESAAELVEAPGTAPGSATLIPQSVYRHSQAMPDPDTYRRSSPSAPVFPEPVAHK